MPEFAKNYYRSLDTKGRLMLPVDYREVIKALSPTGNFVLTGVHGRLVAYSPEAWQNLKAQLSKVKNPSVSMGRFISKVRGLAEELTPDAQGRVRIPQPLMHAAKLEKDIMLVGMDYKFEIWDRATFADLELEDVSEELSANNVEISF